MTIPESSINSTVLANTPAEFSEFNQKWTPNFKHRIIEFYGFEGEDFRHFRSLLDSFFAIHGITQDLRKVVILKAQLRRAASVFFASDIKSKNLDADKITYQEAIDLLQNRYLSKDLLDEYEYAFQAMKQSTKESPQMFLSRLHEAADLADIKDDKLIFSRFRAGLLPIIITFCKEQASSSHVDWVKNSNAWWSAHATKTIHLIDNPFASTGSYFNGIKFNSEKVKNDIMSNSLRSEVNDNRKPHAEAYSSVISPSIEQITAKLEALELHSLIPHSGYKGKIDSTIQTSPIKSLITDTEFKSFIKNIVQEVHNEKVPPYILPKNNRKSYYNNDHFNDDQNYQSTYHKNSRNRNFNSYNENEGHSLHPRYEQSRYQSYNNAYNNRNYNVPPTAVRQNNYNQVVPQQGNNYNSQRYNAGPSQNFHNGNVPNHNRQNAPPPQNNYQGNYQPAQRYHNNHGPSPPPHQNNYHHGSSQNQKN